MEEQQQYFVDLIEQNKALIYKFCYMYSSEADTPQDLFQEVVINLWKGYPSFRGECKVQTWIYRIALNTCVTFLRKSGVKPHTMPLSDDMIVYDDSADQSQIRELYSLINRLSEIEKAIVLLYLEERSYDEIALIVGITRNNVGVRINRIKEKLAQMSNC